MLGSVSFLNRRHMVIIAGLERNTNVANSLQASKRARQNERRRQANVKQRSRFRSLLKKAKAVIDGESLDKAIIVYKEFSRVADRAARKGIIHRNKSARHKSSLASTLKVKAQGQN